MLRPSWRPSHCGRGGQRPPEPETLPLWSSGKDPQTPPWRGHPAWHTTGMYGTRGEQTGTQPLVTGPHAGPRGGHPTMGAKGLWSPSRQGWGVPGGQQGWVTRQPDPGREACSAVWPPGPGADAGMDTAGPAELGRPPSSKSSARPPRTPTTLCPLQGQVQNTTGGGSPASAHSACSMPDSVKTGLDLARGECSWNHQPFLQQKPRLHAPIPTGLTGRASTPLTP